MTSWNQRTRNWNRFVVAGWRSAPTRWSLLCASVFLLAIQGWGLRLWGAKFDPQAFGTMGEWVSGIGTFAAVVVALSTTRNAQRFELGIKSRERDMLLTAIYVWLSRSLDMTTGSPLGWSVSFTNATPQPVYYWVTRIEGVNGHLCHVINDPILPGRSTRGLVDRQYAPPASDQVPRAMIEFVDSAGRLWVRNYDGSCELSDPGPFHVSFHTCSTAANGVTP